MKPDPSFAIFRHLVLTRETVSAQCRITTVSTNKIHLNAVLFSLSEHVLFLQPYLSSKFSLEERETCVLELQCVGYEEA